MHLWTRIFVEKDICPNASLDIDKYISNASLDKDIFRLKLKSTAGLSMVEHASPMTKFRISKMEAYVKGFKGTRCKMENSF